MQCIAKLLHFLSAPDVRHKAKSSMKKLLYILVFYGFASNLNEALFELSASETREHYSFIQLQYGTGEVKPFSRVFSKIKPNMDTVAIHILGEFSDKTNEELLSFYEKEIPTKLEVELESSGNLHNPATLPLSMNFSSAFKQTTLYRNITKELANSDYNGSSIEFEKYTINPKGSPKILVADIG